MSLPSKRPLDDQHDLSTRALIRREAESTDAPPPSTTHPPPPKRPRTSLPATVPSTGPTPSHISTPISLIHRSFTSAQNRTYTRLSLAETQRLPADSVAAYAHALQRALDITTQAFNERIKDRGVAHSVAKDIREVGDAVCSLLDTPVWKLEKEVERVVDMTDEAVSYLDGTVFAAGGYDRDGVKSDLDFKADFDDVLLKTSALSSPLGQWHMEFRVRWMRSEVCTSVLDQMKWWPELRNKARTGRWSYDGNAWSRKQLLELLALANFRGAQVAADPLGQEDFLDFDDPIGPWRLKSLPLAKWKESMGDLEKEIPGEGTLTVRGPSISFYFSQETFDYYFYGEYGL